MSGYWRRPYALAEPPRRNARASRSRGSASVNLPRRSMTLPKSSMLSARPGARRPAACAATEAPRGTGSRCGRNRLSRMSASRQMMQTLRHVCVLRTQCLPPQFERVFQQRLRAVINADALIKPADGIHQLRLHGGLVFQVADDFFRALIEQLFGRNCIALRTCPDRRIQTRPRAIASLLAPWPPLDWRGHVRGRCAPPARPGDGERHQQGQS